MRKLSPEENEAAQQVFVGGLDYARVRISEGSEFPNLIGRIGARLRNSEPPAANAITFLDISIFPRKLTSDIGDMCWLIHELTHQWQYQNDGIRYLWEAIGAPTYEYKEPGESPSAALKRHFSTDKKHFRDFNREQQGDIVRDYYFALKQAQGTNSGIDLSAWEPYLQEIRLAKGNNS